MTLSPLSALILAIGALGTVSLASGDILAVGAQDLSAPVAPAAADVLLTMPILAEKGWFIHAHNGRVRACTADGASVAGERPSPKCSNWSEQ